MPGLSARQKQKQGRYNRLAGRLAEGLAVCALRLGGWRVLARNNKTSGVEVDILCRKGHTLAVAEVKYRKTRPQAHVALAPAQRDRLQRALAWWQGHLGHTGPVQLDVLLIYPHPPFFERHTQGL